MKILASQVDKAFAKEKDIKAQLKKIEMSLPSDDRFMSVRFQDELYIEDAKKVGDIWQYPLQINGSNSRIITAYSIWRDFPNYMKYGKMTSEEILSKGETQKVLFKGKGFSIVWLRDVLRPPTDTYWGYKVQAPVYALLDDKGEILVKDEKAWRFKKRCLGEYIEPNPQTLYEKLALGNPFKMKIVPFSDVEIIKHLQEILPMSHFQFNQYLKNKTLTENKNLYVVFFLGYDRGEDNQRETCTWIFMESKTLPTFDEALIHLKNILEKYLVGSEFVDYLEAQRKIFKVDLNKLDLYLEARFHYLVNGKLQHRIKDVFNKRLEEFYSVFK